MHANSIFVFDTRLPSPDNLATTNAYEYWSTYTSSTRGEVKVYGLRSEHSKLEDTMLLHIRRDFENGEQYDSHIELKYWPIEKITEMLDRSGLKLVERYSHWDKAPFTEPSTNFVGVVKRL